MERILGILCVGSVVLLPHLADAEERATPPAATKMHSPGLVAGGAVLTTIGAVSLGFAVAAVAISVPSWNSDDGLGRAIFLAYGLPFASSAIGGLVGGISMIVVGVKRIPAPTSAPPPDLGGGAVAAGATITIPF